MRGRESICFWQILFMDHHGILCHAFHERRPACHQSVNKRVKWLGHTAVLLFSWARGCFPLWNVPLNTLGRPCHHSSFRHFCQGKFFPNAAAWLWNLLLASIQPFLKHYVETVTNAGRLDFSSHVPQEVEIRMEGLFHRPEPFSGRFNFRTKYGFSMQTSRKPDASDRAIYQWLKNRMKAENGRNKYGHRYRTE